MISQSSKTRRSQTMMKTVDLSKGVKTRIERRSQSLLVNLSILLLRKEQTLSSGVLSISPKPSSIEKTRKNV